MNKRDGFTLLTLGLLAVFIWFRDTSWMSTSDDTLPILIALPVFFWLGMPWKLKEGESPPLPTGPTVATVCLFLFGILIESTLLMAIGWTLMLWTWLKLRTPTETHSSLKKLLVLPIMSFPWITLDLQQVGWWFRLSGAWITAQLFTILGYEVTYEGTTLAIDQLPISVEAACAGLNTLQSMLIAGSVVAFILLGSTNRYWINLPILFVMAWFANTLRIILISAVALGFGREFAMGAFHTWGGWFILVIMFGLCWLIFQAQEPKISNSSQA